MLDFFRDRSHPEHTEGPMTPDEILRFALDKITAKRQADEARLGEIQAETSAVMSRLADAKRAETGLAAILAREPLPSIAGSLEGSAPSAGGEPVPLVEAPAPAVEAPEPQPTNFRPVEPEVAAPLIATIVPPAAPETKPALPGPADPGRDEAIRAAKAESPTTRDERRVRVLAAAAIVRALGTQTAATAARFGVHGTELAPSMLRKVGITEQEVVAVAKALTPKKGAAPSAKAPEPEPATDPARELADELLNDLPMMLKDCPAGVSSEIIATWFGCTKDQAKDAAVLLIRDGTAIAVNKLLRLPAGEAVSA